MPLSVEINQLAIVVVSGAQSGQLMQRLTKQGFYFTKIDSSGGVIQEPNICLLIGLNQVQMPQLLALIRKVCKPYRQYIPAHANIQPYQLQPAMIEAKVGGAIVYAIEVERFEQI